MCCFFLFLFIGTLSNNEVDSVYICTGTYAYSYHKTDKCEGLNLCSKEIKKVSNFTENVVIYTCRLANWGGIVKIFSIFFLKISKFG